jgi:predicted transposase/invertase (TIGR01784 family)
VDDKSIQPPQTRQSDLLMKTDALFYELFQVAPQTFFELLQITPACPYRFESITVKTAEKRIDGVLEPVAENQPIYFLEVQAFPDDVIYWRVMREVATYFEQRPAQKGTTWQAIVLWLNPEDDPGLGTLKPLARKPHRRLLAVDLLKLLKKLDEQALVLNVLRPLLAKSEREVRQHVVQWVETPNLERQTEERLVAILSQLIEQKFRTLSYKELTAMLHLTPLRETASVQEVLKEDRVDMLMRQIQTKFSLSAELRQALTTDLFQLDMEALKTLIEQILRINSIEELEQWIAEQSQAVQRR